MSSNQRSTRTDHNKRLQQVRSDMHECAREIIRAGTPGVHLFKSPTGSGKTWALAPLTAEPNNVAWVSPYHVLGEAEEGNPYLSELNHVYGLRTDLCQHYAQARTLIDKGLQSGIVHDTPCLYTAQFKSGVSSFYVHQHLYTGHPWKHDVVVIDEAPLGNLLRTRKISFRDIGRNYRRDSQEHFLMESAAIVRDDYLHRLYDLALDKGDDVVRRYYYAMGQEFMQMLDSEMHGQLAEVLMCLNYRYDLSTLRPKPDTRLLTKETIDLQQSGDLIVLASALHEELPLYRAGKPYNSRVQLSKAGLTITQAVPMPEQLPTVIVLSATAQADLLEHVFHTPVQEHVFDVPPHPTTTHIALDSENKVWTRTAMTDSRNIEKRVARAAKIVKFGLHMVEPGSLGVISFKPCMSRFAEQFGIEAGDTMYYGYTLGKNGFQSRDTVVLVGEPRIPEYENMRMAHALHFGERLPILSKADPCYQQVSHHTMHEELTQAAGRLRAVCEPGKVLITVGTELPDYVPEAQIEVKHMPVLTDDGVIRRDARKENTILAFNAAYNLIKWRRSGKPVSATALAKEAHKDKKAAIEYLKQRQKRR